MVRRPQIVVSVALLLWLSGVMPARAADEVIDRVLAVVSGEIITLSDVRAARALGVSPTNRGVPRVWKFPSAWPVATSYCA